MNYVKDSFYDYLGKKDHISASDIKNFLKSPKYYHYKKYGEKKLNKKEGRHFAVGTAFHEMMLEPELFFDNHVIAQKFNLRTKAGKSQLAEFLQQTKGKSIVYESEIDMISKMCESAMKNPTLTELIKDSYRELSLYTVDETTGLKIRLRPDIDSRRKSTITDIKTCLNSSLKSFKTDVFKYRYDVTAAFYMHFGKKENYVFVAAEKVEPYQISLYCLDDEMIEFGKRDFRMALDLLSWCYRSAYWPDYNEFVILKECRDLGHLDNYFEIIKASSRIVILK